MHSSRMRTARSSSCLLVGGSVSMHAGIHTLPWVWAWRPPPGVGLERLPPVWAWRLPQARPLNFPPGCGPGETSPPPVWTWRLPQARPLNFPPWVWAWRPPRQDPSTSPLSVGLETYKACWDTPPPQPP